MAAKIKTRLLIISDTHGAKPKERDSNCDTDEEIANKPLRTTHTGYRHPLPPSDVLLHCGDLTLKSTLKEYGDTFSAIRAAPAKLKLVIAGNHDLSLDEEYCKYDHWGEHRRAKKEDVDSIIEDAKQDGVVYLDEGTHEFSLENGARLRVYASPWTPVFGGWAFQYLTEQSGGEETVGHKFDIPEGVDVAMTHGPPRGVLDLAGLDKVRAGCEWLFDAVRRARPSVHCYGHIHEAWGSYLAQWEEDGKEGEQKCFTEAVNEEDSKDILRLKTFKPGVQDGRYEQKAKMDRIKEVARKRGVEVDTTGGEHKLEPGKQTLFVNAAIMDIRYQPIQPPWLIDIGLPASMEE